MLYYVILLGCLGRNAHFYLVSSLNSVSVVSRNVWPCRTFVLNLRGSYFEV